MQRVALAFAGLLFTGHACAQTAQSLDLSVPQPALYAADAALPAADPPGTYYGDTSGKSANGPLVRAADDGKAEVWGSFTTGIGHSKVYGTSHYNAAELNVSTSLGAGERPNNVNLQLRVEKSDGPGFGGRGPYPYRGSDPFSPPPR
ncbi:MAG: hypothetical protein ABIO17_04780 [Pseudoxanthomonas sp.]